jgi:hypothetical protein
VNAPSGFIVVQGFVPIVGVSGVLRLHQFRYGHFMAQRVEVPCGDFRDLVPQDILSPPFVVRSGWFPVALAIHVNLNPPIIGTFRLKQTSASPTSFRFQVVSPSVSLLFLGLP